MLDKSKALNCDDLLMRTVRLFDQHPRVLQKYQQRYLQVMIDEF